MNLYDDIIDIVDPPGNDFLPNTTPGGSSGVVLSRTESVCPVCLKRIPASRVIYEEDVYLEKECPNTGSFARSFGVALPLSQVGSGKNCPPLQKIHLHLWIAVVRSIVGYVPITANNHAASYWM
jgi:hypothetical protein